MVKKEKIAEFYRKKRATVRTDETIGGGYVVFKIDADSGRIVPAPVPFEHDEFEKARDALISLMTENPGVRFDLYEICRVRGVTA